MKSAIIPILLLFTSSVFSQEIRRIEKFKEIDVSESITVYLTKGSSNEARIEAYGRDTDRVLLDNVGDRLKVHMRSGNWRNYDAKVYLEFEELESIQVSSSGKVFGKSIIKADQLELEASSSGKMEIEVDVNDLEVSASSSGKITIQGNADYQDIEVNSSGKYYGFDLVAKRAKIDASSSGKAEVNIVNEIDAEANSSGKVMYKGNPDRVYVDSNSGGRVSKY